VANNDACTVFGGDPCCNSGDSCTTYITPAGTSALKCQPCAARGQACTTGFWDTDCCNSDDSCVNNVCTQTCNLEFQSCTNGLDCCRSVDVCYDDTCQYCIEDDEPCEQAGVAYPADCCDSDRTCSRYAFDMTYKCRECLARGAFCATGSTQVPCCGTDICENNICTEDCVAEGDACFMQACCDGKQCRDFVCQDPCVADGATCVAGGDPCCDSNKQCIDGICQDLCVVQGATCVAGLTPCCGDNSCQSGTCQECWSDSGACTMNIPCCVDTQDCILVGAIGSGDMTCQECLARGSACSTAWNTPNCCTDTGTGDDDECVNGVCTQCVNLGEACINDSHCCGTHDCENGACVEDTGGGGWGR
jgi:hypothetical protein